MAVFRRNYLAFTLVELLVVITILGVLVGLLVPAVNSVRESMRRTQCKSNPTQMVVATNAHLTQYGFFPSAGWGMMWLGNPDRGTGSFQPGSWIYQLLPFLGYDMIHDLGNSMLERFDHDVIRWCGSGYGPFKDTINAGCTTNGTSFWCAPADNSFGSAHAAGVNFVYCDGSVRLITYQIDPTTYTYLGCRNDGIVIESY
jgi:prepilin-type N-terminal cleavage/methylation domain-containing protein/prepilin-type processing-associated H-X9-DG protein